MEKNNILSEQSESCVHLAMEIIMLCNNFKKNVEEFTKFCENISEFVTNDINDEFHEELFNSFGDIRILVDDFLQQANFIQMDYKSFISKAMKGEKLCEILKKRYSYSYNYSFLQNDLMYSESVNIKRTCIIINKSTEHDMFYIYDLTYYNTYKRFFSLLRKMSVKPLTKLPKCGELFAVKYFGKICRAVRENTLSISKYIRCFLVDYGIEIKIEAEHSIFDLPHDLKYHPSLAILCKLNMVYPNNFKITKENFYKNVVDPKTKYNFKIVKKKNNFWYLDLEEYHNPFSNSLTTIELQDLNLTCDSTKHNNMFTENSDVKVSEIGIQVENNCLKTDEPNFLFNSCQLTDYEKAVLYEEPLNTTNALKAVMGYEPKDEMRICKFAQNGECFKGSRCKLSHEDKLLSGWTRDKEIVVLENSFPMEVPEIGSFIMIIPTAIESCTTFFAQVHKLDSTCSETSLANMSKIWNSEEEMAKCITLDCIPALFELVFAKYTDGLFYRARIIEISDNNFFIVRYLDYGNIEAVHVSDMKKWDSKFDVIPCQALHFTFANVIVKPEKKGDLLDYLKSNLLNNIYVVKVIDNVNSVYVQIYDKNGGQNLLDIMIDAGFFTKCSGVFQSHNLQRVPG
ncbi:uncharacterized protein LOC129611109 [Condylostylus longicornis]|uniref:uncharacterized protein LOC129611109 n=1 Tax=Condylostylus longicornis TaxID=2530218 RepID=UPI00244DCE1E|nr:uncharacterized protein LOC129611109 [Condylostylus longicornis]